VADPAHETQRDTVYTDIVVVTLWNSGGTATKLGVTCSYYNLKYRAQNTSVDNIFWPILVQSWQDFLRPLWIMYVCMYVLCVYMYLCMYEWMCVCMYVYMYVYVRVHEYMDWQWLGVCDWPRQLIALGKAGRPLFVTSISCIPAKNSLGLNAFVSCACQIIQLFSVVFCLVRAVRKLDLRLLMKETRNKWRPVDRPSSERGECFLENQYVFDDQGR